MRVNIDIFSNPNDFSTMADGRWQFSREPILTDYSLQFSIGNIFRKKSTFTSGESQSYQDEMTDECDTEYRIQFSQQQ